MSFGDVLHVIIKSSFITTYIVFVFIFCNRLLEKKYSKTRTIIVMILYGVVFDYLILDRTLRLEYLASVCISQVVFTFLIILLFKDDTVKKIVMATVVFSINMLSTFLIIPLLSVGADMISNSASGQQVQAGTDYLIFAARCLVACVLLSMISRRCQNLRGQVEKKLSVQLLVPSIFIVAMLNLVYLFSNGSNFIFVFMPEMPFAFNQIVMTLLLFFFSALGLWANCIVVFKTNDALRESLVGQQLTMQIEHYRCLEQQHQQIRSMKHDIKNHAICLEKLILENKTDAAMAYLAHITNGVEAQIICTGNDAADAILNAKFVAAQKNGIQFDCDVKIPVLKKLDSFDLCVIIGNAIDNALEACGRLTLPDAVKFITIQSCVVKSYLLFEIKNSMEEADGEWALHTKKSDHQNHGIGLSNIQSTVAKYSGTMDINLEKNIFKLSLLLPV